MQKVLEQKDTSANGWFNNLYIQCSGLLFEGVNFKLHTMRYLGVQMCKLGKLETWDKVRTNEETVTSSLCNLPLRLPVYTVG